MKTIVSRDNAAYKALVRLATKASERKTRRLSIVEGAHLVSAAMDAGLVPEALLVRHGSREDAQALALLVRAPACERLELADGLFDALSGLDSPPAIMAVVPTPEGRHAPPEARFCLALEDVQDPGNVGTLLRSAAAAGVEHVLLSPTCAFAWSPKVLRAGQGAHFAVNIVEGVDLLAFVKSYGGTSVALCGEGGASLYALDLTGPLLFLVGNEGAGLSVGLEAAAGVRAAIPMPGRAESLNAGVAGSIALFEAVRQRGGGSEAGKGSGTADERR
ncbi:MAG: RNA methyltransferase [Betaproteobacteria bacterium]|nr:RNA methyltransferase [Betaproteobacteria bacterium]